MECKRRHFIQKVSTLGISTFLATVFGNKNSEAETLQATIQECDRRIQVLRTAPIKLLLLDRTGIPITNQIVQVEHIRHLFNVSSG